MQRKILKLLPHRDLMSAMLVCRSWKEMGQDPAMWTLFVVTVETKEDIQKFKVPRLQKIQRISLLKGGYRYRLRDLFQAISAIPSVSKIYNLWTYDLRSLEPGLCASVLARLKMLHFGRELTKEQMEKIFTVVAVEGSKVDEIYIDFSGYGFRPGSNKVSPHLFASAVTHVRVLSMYFPMDYEEEKFQALFRMIIENNRCLKKVKIFMGYHNLLANIEPDILGTALNRL